MTIKITKSVVHTGTGLTQKNLWQIFILQFKSFYKLKLQLKLNF